MLFRIRSCFSLGLQETWRCGKEIFEEDGFTFLGSGPETQKSLGSCGVGLLHSHAATLAWRAAALGNQYNSVGPRVIAARMRISDVDLDSALRIFQVFAYAPTFDSPEANIIHFENALATAISCRGPDDILTNCMDVYASIGCEISDKTEDDAYRTIGPFGITHINRAGYTSNKDPAYSGLKPCINGGQK